MKNNTKIAKDIAEVLNKHSREDVSGTADFVLGDLLSEVLVAFERAIKARDKQGEPSRFVQHARREMSLAGMLDAKEGENELDRAYQDFVNESVLELLKTFSNQNHSGFSAVLVLQLFDKLVRWRTLTPLTDLPEEWAPIEPSEPGGTLQNTRNSEAFSEDGGKTYYLLSEIHGKAGCPVCGAGWTSAKVELGPRDYCGEHKTPYVVLREPQPDKRHESEKKEKA